MADDSAPKHKAHAADAPAPAVPPAAAASGSYASRAAAPSYASLAAAAPTSTAPAASAAIPTGGAGAAAAGPRTKKSVPKLPASASRKKEAWALFERGCREILDKWDLLRTAVIEEWGGHGSRAKYEHIVDDLLLNAEEQWRAGHDLHVDTLDVYLLECLDSDFNVDFEDDEVVTEASLLIQDLYRKCALDDSEGVATLLAGLDTHAITKKTTVDRPGAAGSEDEEGSEDGSEGDEEEGSDDEGEGKPAAGAGGSGSAAAPAQKRVVDEEGWETIPAPKKGRGGKAVAPAGAAAGAGAEAPAAAAPGGSSGADTAAGEAAAKGAAPE